MVRNDEIARLVKYAQALGVHVHFSNIKNPDASADWSLDGKNITIYTNKNSTKIETVLSLVHEIGHQLDHIWRTNREYDDKLDHAITLDDNGESSKKHRKAILNSEIAGTEYWLTIYKETDLKFPIWKLHAQMAFDLWQYYVHYETGEFPSSKQRALKRKELYDKHKKIKYD